MKFVNPLGTALFTFTSKYGSRINPVTKEFQSLHNGVDLAAPLGTAVCAAASGVVEKVVDAASGGAAGAYVKVKHNDKYSTAYMHLSRIDVAPGQGVRAGQTLGGVGSTGRSTGNHLHFIVYLQGVPIDPLPLISWDLAQLARSAGGAAVKWYTGVAVVMSAIAGATLLSVALKKARAKK